MDKYGDSLACIKSLAAVSSSLAWCTSEKDTLRKDRGLQFSLTWVCSRFDARPCKLNILAE